MTFVGMDVEQVRRIAALLQVRARELDEIAARVDDQVARASAVWPGRDNDAFAQEWQTRLRPQVSLVASDLAERARSVLVQVDQQVGASGGERPLGEGSGGVGSSAETVLDATDLLSAANAAYGQSYSGSLHLLTAAELRALGIPPEMLHDSATGYDAKIFRTEDGEYVIAYAGTDLSQAGDLVADVSGAAYLSKQSEQAVALALAMEHAVGSENMHLTGHSLGGRLAAVGAIATGAPATTYNAAGVSPSELLYAQVAGGGSSNVVGYALSHLPLPDGLDGAMMGVDTSSITNYFGMWDPLTGGQMLSPLPDAVGHQVPVAGMPGVGVDNHNVDWLIDNLPRSLDI